MAHEVETMAYAGALPWHGLGVNVGHDLSPADMLKAAGLDWNVEKVAAHSINPVTKKREKIGKSGLYRMSDGVLLDEVSNNWVPLQNFEAFEFFADFVKLGHMQMETAGSLRGGRFVWALAKVNESFELFKGDTVDNYLLFCNPHVYGQSMSVGMNPIRVVCMNTLRLGLNKSNSTEMLKLSHRKKPDFDEVKETLGIAHEKLMQYKAAAAFLGSKRYTAETVRKYFVEVFPVARSANENAIKRTDLSKHADHALGLLETQPGAKYAEGTWWQAANAVTYLTDHIMSKSADTRLYNAWFGTEATRKFKAMELAKKYAEAA